MANEWSLTGDKYSPNLKRWCKKNNRNPSHTVYRDEDGTLWIGWIDEGRWFVGSRLWRVLSSGSRAEMGCWGFPVSRLLEIEEFWPDYAKDGRCAIDRDHSRGFIGDETRWKEDGDERSCLWCGSHRQVRLRWTETVHKERWATPECKPQE